jgi:hypothetical protein
MPRAGLTAAARQITGLKSTVDGHTSSLNILAETSGGNRVRYAVIGTIDGVTGGFTLTGVKDPVGTVQFSFVIDGDLIVLDNIIADGVKANTIEAVNIISGSLMRSIGNANDIDYNIISDTTWQESLQFNAVVINGVVQFTVYLEFDQDPNEAASPPGTQQLATLPQVLFAGVEIKVERTLGAGSPVVVYQRMHPMQTFTLATDVNLTSGVIRYTNYVDVQEKVINILDSGPLNGTYSYKVFTRKGHASYLRFFVRNTVARGLTYAKATAV